MFLTTVIVESMSSEELYIMKLKAMVISRDVEGVVLSTASAFTPIVSTSICNQLTR